MLERVPHQPCQPSSHGAAKAYMPTFLYHVPEDTSSLQIREEFFGSRRKLRLCILGAGISCINLPQLLESNLPLESLEIVVYEREKDVGGVVCSLYYHLVLAFVSNVTSVGDL